MKSYTLGIVLTALFGPFGNFYSSIGAGFALLIGGLFAITVTGGVAVIVLWPLNIIVSCATIASYNEKLQLEQKRHDELVKAAVANAQ